MLINRISSTCILRKKLVMLDNMNLYHQTQNTDNDDRTLICPPSPHPRHGVALFPFPVL